MSETDNRTRGLQAWRDVMESDAPPIADPFMEFTSDHVFGRVWTRPGLSPRDRRLVTLTCAAMVGAREPLVIHLGAAYRSGDLTLEELDEWVVHFAHYGGWPAATVAYGALREVRAHVAASDG